MANAPRDHTRYDYKKGHKIIHSGITKRPLEIREAEHQKRWPGGHATQVGPKVTEETAKKWEETKRKVINPPGKPGRSIAKHRDPKK